MNDRRITLRLACRSALHVGAGQGDAVTDAFVRQNASGQPVIPGTTIAGALRALATRLAPRLGHEVCEALKPGTIREREGTACQCAVCKLFGDINPGEEGERPARAGRLWVHDARPASARTRVRDGVGIERPRRVAYRAGRAKFDLETLPPGTEFELSLELQIPDGDVDVDAEERLLAAVLGEWAAGRAVLGGRVSSGLGALELQTDAPVVYRKLDLHQAKALLAYLRSDDPWPQARVVDTEWLSRRLGEIEPVADNSELPVARSWAELVAEVQFAGPSLVNDPVAAVESSFDHAPFSSSGDPARPTIPGSTLKGALRSVAERIARTLATLAASRKTTPEGRKREFLLHCPACDVLVGEVGEPLASCDALLKQFRVVATTDEADRRHLCLSCQLFGSPRTGSRLRIEDASLVGAAEYKPQDFLAIDRFTGGGAEGLKFDAALLWRPQFRLRLFLENPEPWELGWLVLALRDVAEGLVPLGFGGAKGFGRVEGADWVARVGYLTEGDLPAGMTIPARPEVDGIYRVVRCASPDREQWLTAAEVWVRAFVARVREFGRAEQGGTDWLPELARDSYFGEEAEKLYPPREALDA